MTTTVRRILTSCFVLSVVVAGLATPAPAAAQYGQQRLAEGSHVWADDGWCYVVQAGRLVRTSYRRVFPDRTNPTVFNIYENGRFLRRVSTSTLPAPVYRQPSAEAQLQSLVDQLNRDVAAAARAGAQRGTMAFCAPVQGPFIAHNVRASIPMYGCQTPEEKVHQRNSVASAQNGQAVKQITKRCENGRADHPWVKESQGPDGVRYYQLQDGSVHRRGGTLNPGWGWTQTGPQRTCY